MPSPVPPEDRVQCSRGVRDRRRLPLQGRRSEASEIMADGMSPTRSIVPHLGIVSSIPRVQGCRVSRARVAPRTAITRQDHSGVNSLDQVRQLPVASRSTISGRSRATPHQAPSRVRTPPVRVPATIRSAASRACVRRLQGTSPGRIRLRDPASTTVAGAVVPVATVNAGKVANASMAVRARAAPEHAQASGVIIAKVRATADQDAAAIASEPQAASQAGVHRLAPMDHPEVVDAEVPPVPSDARAAGHRALARIVWRSVRTSRRSKHPSSAACASPQATAKP